MANSFSNDVYRSAKTLSLLAIGCLGMVLLFDLIHAFLGFCLAFFPASQIDLDEGQFISVWMALIGVISLLRIPIFILTVIFFLVWLYRAYNNLPALKAGNLEFSPGWAVGWWFIPIATLFKPFQVIRELWNESDPDFDPELSFLSSNVGAPAFIGFWWACWLIYNITSRISNNLGESSNNDAETFLLIAFIISNVFGVIAAVLAIMIVKGVTQRQEIRFQKLGNLQQFMPPPPPKFD